MRARPLAPAHTSPARGLAPTALSPGSGVEISRASRDALRGAGSVALALRAGLPWPWWRPCQVPFPRPGASSSGPPTSRVPGLPRASQHRTPVQSSSGPPSPRQVFLSLPPAPSPPPPPSGPHGRMGDNTSPISVILVSSGSRGNKLLFRYPFQRSQEHPASQTSKWALGAGLALRARAWLLDQSSQLQGPFPHRLAR